MLHEKIGVPLSCQDCAIQRAENPGRFLKECGDDKCWRDKLNSPDPTPLTLYYMEMYNLCTLMNIPPVQGGLEDQDAKTMQAFMIIKNFSDEQQRSK